MATLLVLNWETLSVELSLQFSPAHSHWKRLKWNCQRGGTRKKAAPSLPVMAEKSVNKSMDFLQSGSISIANKVEAEQYDGRARKTSLFASFTLVVPYSTRTKLKSIVLFTLGEELTSFIWLMSIMLNRCSEKEQRFEANHESFLPRRILNFGIKTS